MLFFSLLQINQLKIGNRAYIQYLVNVLMLGNYTSYEYIDMHELL